jgi:endonuclease/exonuclease/phosphatase family metal-dependent hydrolase
VACGDDESPFRVATYNAGLAFGFVDHTRARAPRALQAMSDLDADLICAQELWDADDLSGFFSATSKSHSHQYNRPPEPDENADNAEPLCTHAALDPLEQCALSSCEGVSLDELAGCVLSHCGTQFADIPSECQTCLAGAIGNAFDEMRSICTTGGGVWAYGGAYGTAIVSRHELQGRDSLRFDSHFNRRAVLYAAVQSADQGRYHVFCTHLSPIFADIPFPADQGSWQQEQAEQIAVMLAYIDEKAADGAPVVLLGDLNTGPAVAGLQGEAPENFELFVAAGYRAPYLEENDVSCTFCPDNPLVGGADGAGGKVIDHVLLRGVDGQVATQRLLDETVELEAGGQAVTSCYSDHYGVGATIR